MVFNKSRAERETSVSAFSKNLQEKEKTFQFHCNHIIITKFLNIMQKLLSSQPHSSDFQITQSQKEILVLTSLRTVSRSKNKYYVKKIKCENCVCAVILNHCFEYLYLYSYNYGSV